MTTNLAFLRAFADGNPWGFTLLVVLGVTVFVGFFHAGWDDRQQRRWPR